MNPNNIGLDEAVQQASTWTLVYSVLFVLAVAVAISFAIYGALYLAMVLDSRKGGRR